MGRAKRPPAAPAGDCLLDRKPRALAAETIHPPAEWYRRAPPPRPLDGPEIRLAGPNQAARILALQSVSRISLLWFPARLGPLLRLVHWSYRRRSAGHRFRLSYGQAAAQIAAAARVR